MSEGWVFFYNSDEEEGLMLTNEFKRREELI